MNRMINYSFIATLAATALLSSSPAHAQDVALPEPVQQPPANAKAGEGEPEIALDVDREIDLANVVTSAAKGVTTVQEAPSIITIITADEILARGHRTIGEALSTVPGWLNIHGIGNQVELPMVRGVGQAALFMRDGMSLFDPWGNMPWSNRTQPLENIKRLEVVTGPGGVLWGANSFLGIVNMITKDAEDVNGIEISAGYGDGSGNKQDFKTYALFGKTFLSGKLKIFQHISYESDIGEVYTVPQFIVSAPAPQPGGTAYYGNTRTLDPPRSWMVIIDGKYTFGPLSLYYMVPFGDQHSNLTFANSIQPGAQNLWNVYDRYGMLEYKDRFLKDRIGVTVKGYGTQFVRDFGVQLYPPSFFFPNVLTPSGQPTGVGGLDLSINQTIFRAGTTADLDFNLPLNIRILVGGEFFYEGIRNSTERFNAPVDSTQVPVVCPVGGSGGTQPLSTCPREFAADTGRFVGAGYVDLQWRPFQKLTIDGGVRIQKGFGDLAYNLVPLGSAAIVYNFLPDFHLKLNYATGFRAPVFQNTSIPAGGIDYGSNAKLQTESSQAFQGELNARVLRNVRKVRELELRADYSYTVLSNLIEVEKGAYANFGKRAIHSVEGYAKLYLNGDHFLQASYTYLNASTTDAGSIRSTPNHWVVLGGSFNIIKSLFDVNANLTIMGAYEDPNRYPSTAATGNGGTNTGVVSATGAATSALTFDRLTPVALLQLGFRLRFVKERLQFSGQFYNVLNQRFWYPDTFYDLTPTVEMTPNPAPGFNFFARASYHF
jgi:outer membrane receptor protein involved in Fe transport